MKLALAVLLALLLLAVWLFVWRRQGNPDGRDGADSERGAGAANTAYHAVSIRFSSNACKAARELEGRRFLSNAAPRLPLPECDVLECNCRFVHHKDRRSGDDRRSLFPPPGFGGTTGRFDEEQRRGAGRRSSDKSDDDDELL